MMKIVASRIEDGPVKGDISVWDRCAFDTGRRAGGAQRRTAPIRRSRPAEGGVMRKSIAIAFILVVGNATSAGTNRIDDATVEKSLQNLEAEFLDAFRTGDASALEKFYADDYTFVSATGGLMTKAQRLDQVRNRKGKLTSVSHDEM